MVIAFFHKYYGIVFVLKENLFFENMDLKKKILKICSIYVEIKNKISSIRSETRGILSALDKKLP